MQNEQIHGYIFVDILI